MQRPGAAERREHEIARVVAALHRDDLQDLRHGVIDDVDDGGRRGGHIDAERLREPLAHRGFGGGMIDRQLAAEQRGAVEIAEQQVAVGDGRLGAAAAVAHRARIGAGALAGRRAAPRRDRPRRSTRRRRTLRRDRSRARGSDGRCRSSSACRWRRRRPRIRAWSRTGRRGSGSPWRWCRPCRRR